MSTLSLARRRQQPKISLHTDLKGLFVLCLIGITATSAAVTTAVQPTWLFLWRDLGGRFATPAVTAPRDPAAAFRHPGVRLGMVEPVLRGLFPNAKTLEGPDQTRVVTFDSHDGTRHMVWFQAGDGAHRIKSIRHYLAGTERQLLTQLDAAFGRPVSGGCDQGGGGCAFTWLPRGGGRVEAALAPAAGDPPHVRLALTFAATAHPRDSAAPSTP